MKGLVFAVAACAAAAAAAKPWAERLDGLFAVDSSVCTMAPADCG